MHREGAKRLQTLPRMVSLGAGTLGRVGTAPFSMQGIGQPMGKQQILALTLGPSLLFSPAGPI